MRRGVGAEEERSRPRSGGAAKRQPVPFALGDGQAIQVRPDAAREDMAAVDHQMMGRDGGAQPPAGVGRDEIGRFLRGDMLEHHLQTGEILQQRDHDPVDEHRLAVEDIDIGVGHLAMDQQRHADPLHPLQHARNLGKIGDAMGRVGRGMRRIELHGGEDAALMPARDLVGIGAVGQIAGHQRLESRSRRQRCPDRIGIGRRLRHRGHGRLQVRHDDGAAELARGIRHDRLQHRAVAQMQVPVIGAADGERGRRRVGVDGHRRCVSGPAGGLWVAF